jgi:heme-degrading monooxygenase HmoA
MEMYARVINSQLVSGKTDEAVSIWRDKVAAMIQQEKGFKGAYLVGNRETGKGLTITLWESKEDADAMNAALPQTLTLFDGLFAAQPSLETYEVLLQV